MSPGYSLKILALLLLHISLNSTSLSYCDDVFETKVYHDASGVQHDEYAFRAPIKGVPNQILRMYCANVKVRLYWNVYREQAKSVYRYGAHLRRMARFAKHVYEDIRKVDKPFNATQLSIIDEHFGVKYDPNAKDDDEEDEQEMLIGNKYKSEENNNPCISINRAKKSRFSSLTKLFNRSSSKLSSSKQLCKEEATAATAASAEATGQIQEPEVKLEESNDALKELESKQSNAASKIKSYFKKYAPKIGVGIYTRWISMWWLMMSCLFAKYYLWDPALDEFLKLQRNLVMYPDIQLVKLQDINCKPIRFFQRILGVCGILNPMMNIDFGQLSLDKMTRFKSDMAKEI